MGRRGVLSIASLEPVSPSMQKAIDDYKWRSLFVQGLLDYVEESDTKPDADRVAHLVESFGVACREGYASSDVEHWSVTKRELGAYLFSAMCPVVRGRAAAFRELAILCGDIRAYRPQVHSKRAEIAGLLGGGKRGHGPVMGFAHASTDGGVLAIRVHPARGCDDHALFDATVNSLTNKFIKTVYAALHLFNPDPKRLVYVLESPRARAQRLNESHMYPNTTLPARGWIWTATWMGGTPINATRGQDGAYRFAVNGCVYTVRDVHPEKETVGEAFERISDGVLKWDATTNTLRVIG